MHPNEIALVFLGATGRPLPTKEYNTIVTGTLTPSQIEALHEQTKRQIANL